MKQEKIEIVLLVNISNDKDKRKKNENLKNEAAKGPPQKKQTKFDKFLFYHKVGHIKIADMKYQAWSAKKGLPKLLKAN